MSNLNNVNLTFVIGKLQGICLMLTVGSTLNLDRLTEVLEGVVLDLSAINDNLTIPPVLPIQYGPKDPVMPVQDPANHVELKRSIKTKEEKAAYMRDYWQKRKDKETKAATEENSPIIETVEDELKEEPATPEKPVFKDPMQVHLANRDVDETLKIRDNIITCFCPAQEKIVKGLEKVYKGHSFYKDSCIEWYVNTRELNVMSKSDFE